MSVDKNTRQAYSEIDEFLSLLDEKTRNEIPLRLRKFFKEEKDNEYHKEINPNIPIKEQNLKSKTLALIALLNLEYWCKDKNEKERLKKVYADNEKKYQQKQREKYNPDNIFKKTDQNEVSKQEALIEYKEPIIKRFFNKILIILHIRK